MNYTNKDNFNKSELKIDAKKVVDELNIKEIVSSDVKVIASSKKEEEIRKTEAVKKNKRTVTFAVSTKVEIYEKVKKWYESSSDNETSDEEEWTRY
jgi:hypothetical protein